MSSPIERIPWATINYDVQPYSIQYSCLNAADLPEDKLSYRFLARFLFLSSSKFCTYMFAMTTTEMRELRRWRLQESWRESVVFSMGCE